MGKEVEGDSQLLVRFWLSTGAGDGDGDGDDITQDKETLVANDTNKDFSATMAMETRESYSECYSESYIKSHGESSSENYSASYSNKNFGWRVRDTVAQEYESCSNERYIDESFDGERAIAKATAVK